MSELVVQKAAFERVEKKNLDQHEHYRPHFSQWLMGEKWICNEGNVKTYEVCQVLANYTAKNWHDLSYLAYRVWNGVKAIFDCSDWQLTVRSIAKNSFFGGIDLLETPVYRDVERGLNKVLNLNWKNGEKVQMEGPKYCKLANVVTC